MVVANRYPRWMLVVIPAVLPWFDFYSFFSASLFSPLDLLLSGAVVGVAFSAALNRSSFLPRRYVKPLAILTLLVCSISLFKGLKVGLAEARDWGNWASPWFSVQMAKTWIWVGLWVPLLAHLLSGEPDKPAAGRNALLTGVVIGLLIHNCLCIAMLAFGASVDQVGFGAALAHGVPNGLLFVLLLWPLAAVHFWLALTREARISWASVLLSAVTVLSSTLLLLSIREFEWVWIVVGQFVIALLLLWRRFNWVLKPQVTPQIVHRVGVFPSALVVVVLLLLLAYWQGSTWSQSPGWSLVFAVIPLLMLFFWIGARGQYFAVLNEFDPQKDGALKLDNEEDLLFFNSLWDAETTTHPETHLFDEVEGIDFDDDDWVDESESTRVKRRDSAVKSTKVAMSPRLDSAAKSGLKMAFIGVVMVAVMLLIWFFSAGLGAVFGTAVTLGVAVYLS